MYESDTTDVIVGPADTVPERTGPRTYHRADQVQLRLGTREEPTERSPGRGREALAGYVPFMTRSGLLL